MIRYLTLGEVLLLHRQLIATSGGASGVRDLGMLESAVATPRQTYAGVELYPDLAAKAGALGFSLTSNHPFVDGNKRVGHAALETMLLLNGFELVASVDEQERRMLALASGELSRAEFSDWVRERMRPATS